VSGKDRLESWAESHRSTSRWREFNFYPTSEVSVNIRTIGITTIFGKIRLTDKFILPLCRRNSGSGTDLGELTSLRFAAA